MNKDESVSENDLQVLFMKDKKDVLHQAMKCFNKTPPLEKNIESSDMDPCQDLSRNNMTITTGKRKKSATKRKHIVPLKSFDRFEFRSHFSRPPPNLFKKSKT